MRKCPLCSFMGTVDKWRYARVPGTSGLIKTGQREMALYVVPVIGYNALLHVIICINLCNIVEMIIKWHRCL